MFFIACHWYSLRKHDDYFWVSFAHFWSKLDFFETAAAVLKIGLSLNPNHNNKVKLVKNMWNTLYFESLTRLGLIFLPPNTRLVNKHLGRTRLGQNLTCMALIPLPFSILLSADKFSLIWQPCLKLVSNHLA